MADPLRLLCIFAHPDDETLSMGSALAAYAARGVETYVLTATRGERGWFGPPEQNPGPEALGRMRERELRAAAAVLGIRQVSFLGYRDGDLDQADVAEAIAAIVTHVREVRPQVVVTFSPDGDYGHPDHIAISQLASAALVCAADARYGDPGLVLPPHRVDKLYYVVQSPALAAAISELLGDITIEVDGQLRRSVTWPDWAITTRVDGTDFLPTAIEAVYCHRSQLPSLGNLDAVDPDQWARLLGHTYYCRAYSLVNGGRGPESDLFAGLVETT